MNDILTQIALEMLSKFQDVLAKFNIEYYLVGAVARDIGLSADPTHASSRRTQDIDIALLIADQAQFYDIKAALVDTGDFSADPSEAIKFTYKGILEVDLLPFGEIENELREARLESPRLFILDVPGFKELLPYADYFEISPELRLKVCSLEGLVLLKIISSNDRPERIKDITDIEDITKAYFDLTVETIFSEHEDAADLYDHSARNYLQLVGARVIGRRIGRILADSPNLRNRIIDILNGRVVGQHWTAIADGIMDMDKS
ncbi:hypothetical protein DCC81_03885 [Chitinophaga parva]|uniref:Nucleotidyltransferase n=1 Tax=Chitinophaga parva TaxID=2169414 RepID=A0A2T7BLS9_9BACT|nr:hypothetical protein [Chitinophaga parva]PUZ28634.1 hypothetical protein DCC81_03885 [Chitinophaga parva]